MGQACNSGSKIAKENAAGTPAKPRKGLEFSLTAFD
jgi:hypothetical protein